MEHHDAAMKIGGFEECVNAKNMLFESTDILQLLLVSIICHYDLLLYSLGSIEVAVK